MIWQKAAIPGNGIAAFFLYSAPTGGGAEVRLMECYCFMYMGSQVTMAGKAMMRMMPTT